jgi:hypothetical protein
VFDTIEILERFQSKALRMIMGAPWYVEGDMESRPDVTTAPQFVNVKSL